MELVRNFGLLAHAYADDLQVYCHMNVVLNRLCCNDSEIVLILLVNGCPRIDSSLNPSKTELIWFHSGRRQLNFVENDIELFGNRIAPGHTVRDFRVMLDSYMTMSQHVLRVCQNCYFQIRLIR